MESRSHTLLNLLVAVLVLLASTVTRAQSTASTTGEVAEADGPTVSPGLSTSRNYIPVFAVGGGWALNAGRTGGITILQPLASAAYNASVRGVLFAGTTLSAGGGRPNESSAQLLTTELGVGVRMGYPLGFFFAVSWAPTFVFSRNDDEREITSYVRGVTMKFGFSIHHLLLMAELRSSGSFALSLGHGF